MDITLLIHFSSHPQCIHVPIRSSTGQLCEENTPATLCPAGSYCPDPATRITCPSGFFCPKLSTAPIACRGVAAGSCHTGSQREVVWVPLLIALVILAMIILPIHIFPMWLSPRWLIRARGLLRSGSKTSSTSSKSKKSNPAIRDVATDNASVGQAQADISRPQPLVSHSPGGGNGSTGGNSGNGGGDVLLETSKSSVGPLRITIRFEDMMLVTGQTRRINGVSGLSFLEYHPATPSPPPASHTYTHKHKLA